MQILTRSFSSLRERTKPSMGQTLPIAVLLAFLVSVSSTASISVPIAAAQTDQDEDRPHRAVIVESFSRVKDESGGG